MPSRRIYSIIASSRATAALARRSGRPPTISFRLLYGLLIVGHGRRQILSFGVTAHPTAEWIANQITEACGWEQAPRYLIRDRDGAYGEVFIRRLRSMGIRDRPTSPRSPWQNGYAERLMGSIRRECLDHVVVFSERHLRHLLLSYMKYYNGARTHLSLDKDAPISRTVDRRSHSLSPNPGRAASPICPDLRQAHVAVDGVAVTNDVSRRYFPTISLGELLRNPFSRWVCGHSQPQHLAPIVMQYQQPVEQSE